MARVSSDILPRPVFSRPWFVVGLILVILLIVVGLILFKLETVKGNEMAILETFGGGVQADPLMPKTYFYFPGFFYHVYAYDMSAQVYVMNDKPMEQEKVAAGREKDAYRVQSSDQQDMHFSINIRWRLAPEHLVHYHKTVREHPEEKVIRPFVLRCIKDEATVRKATDAYSGMGLVQLQQAIDKKLCDPDSDLRKHGIIVENFVIEEITLDPKYVEEIKARQIAMQKELRAVQEEKAAMAEAQKCLLALKSPRTWQMGLRAFRDICLPI